MSLRELNRHRGARAVLMLYSLAWTLPITSAESPPTAARVASLAPISPEQPAPTVTALAIDPTGNWLAVAGDDTTIRILDASTFAQVSVLHGHRDLVRSVQFRTDGKLLASSGNDGIVILWDRASGYQELRRVDKLPAIACASFSPNGKQLAAVGFGPEVMMFGSSSDRAEMRCDCNDLRACVFNPQGTRLAVAGRSGHLHLFDPYTGAAVEEYDLHAGRIRACEFTSDGNQVITVGEDGTAILFDLSRAEIVRRIDLLPCKLFALARIDDRHVAVAGSDNQIRIVDFGSGLVVMRLDGHRGSISTLVYKNGSLFSGGFDSTLRRWSIQRDSGERLAEKDLSPSPPQETSSR